jgi:hypothetical protein
VGREQSGPRKQIYLHIAVLTVLVVSGCSFLPSRGDEQGAVTKKEERVVKDVTEDQAALGRKLFGDGDFAGALREYEKASLSPNGSVVQESLLYIGLIYLDPSNTKRDYGKSIAQFRKLAENYPRNHYTEQARVLLSILKENDEASRAIERLKALIEASKKVDIGIEDRKRERVR